MGSSPFATAPSTAGLAVPDMRVPIAHCLGYPARLEASTRRLDLTAIAKLEFAAAGPRPVPGAAASPWTPWRWRNVSHRAQRRQRDRRGRVPVGRHRLSRHCGSGLRLLELMGQGGARHAPDSVDEALAVDDEARRRATERMGPKRHFYLGLFPWPSGLSRWTSKKSRARAFLPPRPGINCLFTEFARLLDLPLILKPRKCSPAQRTAQRNWHGSFQCDRRLREQRWRLHPALPLRPDHRRLHP